MRTLQKDVGTTYVMEEVEEEPGCPYFGLTSTDLTTIKPNYEVMIKLGHLKVNDLTNSGLGNTTTLRIVNCSFGFHW